MCIKCTSFGTCDCLNVMDKLARNYKTRVYQCFMASKLRFFPYKIVVERMATLISSWSNNVQSVPAAYVFPPEKRPGEVIVPSCKTIPVIDLGQVNNRTDLLQQIIRASQEFGLFQVINHGVPENLMDDTMNVFNEFFDMPAEEKENLCSEDPNKSCRLYTSMRNFAEEEVHYWKDTLRHFSHPLEDHMESWPEKPDRYREVVGTYTVEVRKLSLRILDLICEGLGLEMGYFGEELSKNQLLLVNHYPTCPDPSLVLGVPGRCDPNLITILQQEVHGLQTFKDGKWIGVEPVPNAFVVNIGYQLQIISNGKVRSTEHRAVTNSSAARTSIVTFISPSRNCVIEPAKALVSSSNPPLFRAFQYKEFIGTYTAKSGDYEAKLEPFKLQA